MHKFSPVFGAMAFTTVPLFFLFAGSPNDIPGDKILNLFIFYIAGFLYFIFQGLRSNVLTNSFFLGAGILVIDLIFTYATAYRLIGLCFNGSCGNTKPVDALYFSITTWTTLGYGDFSPTAAARMIAASEALIGQISMALFIAVLLRILSRAD